MTLDRCHYCGTNPDANAVCWPCIQAGKRPPIARAHVPKIADPGVSPVKAKRDRSKRAIARFSIPEGPMTQRFTIPLGPSINSYYTGKERRFVSNLGKKFRRRAIEVMREQGVQRMGGRLSVVLLIHFAPGRRLNDLDNRCKAALDAMQKGGAYHDDSQIDRLLVDRGAAVDGGKIEVTIVRLT